MSRAAPIGRRQPARHGIVAAVAFLLALVAACTTPGDPTFSAAAASAGTPEARAFRDCPDCPALVVVPAGRFAMGSPPDEAGRDGPRSIGEGPQHTVAIAAFAIGRQAVTRREWAAFVAATGHRSVGGCAWSGLPGSRRDGVHPDAAWDRLGFLQDDDHPAVCIGWTDAADYVAWLSRTTGHRYRLLTEAEWEYAARGGSTTPFPWGVEARRDRANYGAERCCSGIAEGADRWTQTSPVDAFPSNGFGLRDAVGNAMTWVADCVSADYDGAPGDGSANLRDVALALPAFPALRGSACDYRVLRGGNWGDSPAMIRVAARNFGPPPGHTLATYRSAGGGLRVARDLAP